MFDRFFSFDTVLIFLFGVVVGAAGVHKYYKQQQYTFSCPDNPVMSVYFKETGEFRCVYDINAISADRHHSAPTKKSLETKKP